MATLVLKSNLLLQGTHFVANNDWLLLHGRNATLIPILVLHTYYKFPQLLTNYGKRKVSICWNHFTTWFLWLTTLAATLCKKLVNWKPNLTSFCVRVYLSPLFLSLAKLIFFRFSLNSDMEHYTKHTTSVIMSYT